MDLKLDTKRMNQLLDGLYELANTASSYSINGQNQPRNEEPSLYLDTYDDVESTLRELLERTIIRVGMIEIEKRERDRMKEELK